MIISFNLRRTSLKDSMKMTCIYHVKCEKELQVAQEEYTKAQNARIAAGKSFTSAEATYQYAFLCFKTRVFIFFV